MSDLGFLLVSDSRITIATVTAADGTTSFNLSARVLSFGTFCWLSRILLAYQSDSDWPAERELSLDNLRHKGSVSAPEPSALLLLAAGGVTIFRCKKSTWSTQKPRSDSGA